jgi:toxin ParE1/3/4
VSNKPLLRRRAARLDTEAASDYYEQEAGPDVARRFLEAVRASLDSIRDRPGAGSLRYADMLGIRGLRSRPVTGFPHLVFYLEEDAHIEVVRILHARSDIPTRLTEGDDRP